jgi:hypothetical protein
MSYSTREHVEDCETAVVRAKMMAEHYPDAWREKVGGRWEWSDKKALANATGFSVEVIEKKGDDLPSWDRHAITFYPYHELRSGDVVARVYAAGWCERVEHWDFMTRLRARPDVHAAILAMLKEQR